MRDVPSEVTITATIVAFVLIAVTVSSITMIINAVLSIHNQALKSLQKSAEASHQIILIKSAKPLNATSILVNFTVAGISIVPLTAVQVIVRYLDTSNETETYLLTYNESPGWLIEDIYVGNSTRTISSGDYLAPGEIAEILVKLPTPASTLEPVLLVIVSPIGSRGEYSVGW